MKIAIDISPLSSGHKVRGTGFYLHHLKSSLLKYYPENQYDFFIEEKNIRMPQIIHYPYFDPFQITLPIRKTSKRVVTVHDLIPIVYPKNFPKGVKGLFKWQLQKTALRNTDAIITDSIASKTDILRFTNIPEKIVHVVYLAAGEEFKLRENGKINTKITKKYALPEKFVLYVGDITWNKNLPNLIYAIKELDISLVIVGKALSEDTFDSKNPWNTDLVTVRKLIHKDERFIRLGFIPQMDLVSLYQAATLLAMPSRYEGFGLPILEAMQSGCPVVTSKTGSLSEVAGESAYFVDPDDISNIARGISEVLSSEIIQKKLSQKGIEQAKKFSWKKTARETIEVYDKVLRN